MTDATAYADGSCLGNPGPGGWGVHVQFGDGRGVDLGGGEQHTTNNRMELRAAIEAVRATLACPSVTVIVDSEYVKKGITSWVAGWKKNGWRTRDGSPVVNKELWEELDALADKRITWQWTRAHVGTAGNERVDTIARWFAGGMGRTRGRPVAPHNASRPQRERSPEPARRASSPGTRYLSMIDGVAMRHRTWPECQDRVSGVARAKFRKAQSDDEERKILQEWGTRPEDLVELLFEVKRGTG
ncbi:MAG: ribonuclease HI [Chloroflexota bacterium]